MQEGAVRRVFVVVVVVLVMGPVFRLLIRSVPPVNTFNVTKMTAHAVANEGEGPAAREGLNVRSLEPRLALPQSSSARIDTLKAEGLSLLARRVAAAIKAAPISNPRNVEWSAGRSRLRVSDGVNRIVTVRLMMARIKELDSVADMDSYMFTGGSGANVALLARGVDVALDSQIPSSVTLVSARGFVASEPEERRFYQALVPSGAVQSRQTETSVNVGHLDDADFSVCIPPQMIVGKPSTVVLRLDKRKLRNASVWQLPSAWGSIRVGNFARTRLVADRRDFDVADSPPEQIVWEDEPTEFYFVITPLRAGPLPLKLILAVRIRVEGSDAIREHLVADRRIPVSHDFGYEVREQAPKWVPIFAVVGPAFAGFVLFVRRRLTGERGRAGF